VEIPGTWNHSVWNGSGADDDGAEFILRDENGGEFGAILVIVSLALSL
jgi:hypothetical protein